jgi:hypothetical protein
MRRFLRTLAGVWLACQVVGAASPLMLLDDRFGIDQASCCPGVGPGQVCPMHHHSAGGRGTCKMESACAHHDATLLTILAVGVVPPAAATTLADARIAFESPLASSTLSRAAAPDVPPPQPLA